MLIPTAVQVALLSMAAGTSADQGRRVFFDPGVGTHGVSCATCHANVKDEQRSGDGLRRAGHTLYGVAKRKYWRGDGRRKQHATLMDAARVCLVMFQGGDSFSATQKVHLRAYLRSISPRPDAPLQIRPALEANLDYDRTKYRVGDADAGRTLFHQACHSCHPQGRAGLGPDIRGKTAIEVARKAREGNGLLRGARKEGAWMPFFGEDRLSHQQVANIGAYVETLSK